MQYQPRQRSSVIVHTRLQSGVAHATEATPLLFENDGPQSVEYQRSLSVAKAEVSKSEKTKTGLKQTTDSNAAHSIATLLDDWSTLSLNSA